MNAKEGGKSRCHPDKTAFLGAVLPDLAISAVEVLADFDDCHVESERPHVAPNDHLPPRLWERLSCGTSASLSLWESHVVGWPTPEIKLRLLGSRVE